MQPTDATDIEALYRQHGPALLLFAVAITGEPSRAQEVIHQVFLKLIESGNAFQPLDIKVYVFALRAQRCGERAPHCAAGI